MTKNPNHWLFTLCASIALSIYSAGSLSAQDNLFQITRVSPGAEVLLPAETTGRADFDQTISLSGVEGSLSRLTAPQDDAVLVAHPGSVVTLRNVVLQQDGATRFGIYVNGGRVELENCEIRDFDTGIYLGAGSVLIRNCLVTGGGYGIAAQAGTTLEVEGVRWSDVGDVALYATGAEVRVSGAEISGAGNTDIYLAGPGRASLQDLSIDGQSATKAVLLNGLNATLTNLRVTGRGDGIVAQQAGDLSVSGLGMGGDLASGLIVQGAGSLELTGFAVSAQNQPMQLSGLGPIRLSDGQITATPGAYGLSVFDAGQVALSDLRIKGGEIGLFAEGPLSHLTLQNSRISGASVYGVLLQNLWSTDGANLLSENEIIATGDAIALAALEGGFVDLENNRLIVEGPTAVYLQASGLSSNVGNTLVAAPARPEETLLFYPDTGEERRILLQDGPIDPIEGWVDTNQGNRVLSHIQALRASDDDTLRRDLAAIAGGVSGDPGATLANLALDLTLSTPSAPEKVTLDLPPPAPGMQWSDKAIAVVLTPIGGAPQVFSPADFPISVPKGQYRLTVDGTFQDILTLSQDETLKITPPAGPFAIWRDEAGTVWRGPGLQLRAPNALIALAEGMRPLRPGEHYGHQPSRLRRAGVSQDQAAQAVATAKTALPELIPRLSTAREAEDWDAYNRLWLVQRMYFEILATLGTLDDAAWVLTAFGDGTLPYHALISAVAIEGRYGAPDDSPTLAYVSAGLAADPAQEQLRQLAGMLARTGDARAIALLLRLNRQDRQSATPLTLPRIGTDVFDALPPTLALPVYRAFLTRLRDNAWAAAQGVEIDWPDLYTTEVWRNATRAILYLARFGTREDRALFDLPIPIEADFYPISAILHDPAQALEVYYGGSAPVPDYRIHGWQSRYGEILCPALSLSPQERIERVSLTSKWAMREAVIRELVPDYFDRDARSRQGLDTSITMVTEVSQAHCGMTETVYDLAMGENAAGEYARKLAQSDLSPAWWVRPTWAADRMATLGRNAGGLAIEGLAPYDTDWLLTQMTNGGPGDPELRAAFTLWHRLTTDAFQSPQNFFPFGADRRVFRLRNGGGDGSLSLAGIVDVRALAEDGHLMVAISNHILSPDYGGLAAMIDAPDREPFERENHRNMIEYVRLEREGQTTEGQFRATLDGGVHLFEVPFDGSPANTFLRLGLQFREDHWPLDFGLFDMDLGYRSKLAATLPLDMEGEK